MFHHFQSWPDMDWINYKRGFGEPDEEYWIGLDPLLK